MKVYFTQALTSDALHRAGLPVTEFNLYSLRVCINTHLQIVHDLYGEDPEFLLYDLYKTVALGGIFSSLKENARILTCLSDEPPMFDGVAASLCCYIYSLCIESSLEYRDMLLCLRYPLRLTLESDDNSVEIFSKANKSCKDWFARMNHFTGVDRLKMSDFEHLLEDRYGVFCRPTFSLNLALWNEMTEVAQEWVVPDNVDDLIDVSARFSSGSTRDVGRSLKRKVEQVAESGHICWTNYAYGYDPQFSQWSDMVDTTSTVLFVPKNFEAKRTIGELPASRAYWAQGVRSALLGSLPRAWRESIDIEDAYASRALAYLGSVNHECDTIDLTNASDRVPKDLVRLLFPQWIPYLDLVWDESFEVDDRVFPAYMYSCAGNATTFVIETAVFYVIAEAARRLVPFCRPRKNLIRVYGDDIIVPTEITDLTMRGLTMCNAIPNYKKTFIGSSRYREACGAEYMDGIDMSSQYFPRGFRGKASQLVALQHALYRFPSARNFLASEVRARIPGMTSHRVGTPCTDLWSEIDLPKRAPAKDVLPGVTSDQPIALYYTLVPNLDRGLIGDNVLTYREFLLHGPRFDDALSELLLTSTSSRVAMMPPRKDKDGHIIDAHYELCVD